MALDRRDLLKGGTSSTLVAASLGAFPTAQPASGASPIQFRIHPAIGIARVGNSAEFYFSPETEAGEVSGSGPALWGGLPLDCQTGLPIAADGFRDSDGRLKRQAIRFRIYAYSSSGYPTGEGREIMLGCEIDGKIVKDIVWSAHLANKKLNNYAMESQPDVFPGIAAYQDGKTPAVRWAQMGPLDSEIRLRTLVIDPGPRAISARANAGQTLAFDKATAASSLTESGTVSVIAHYPKSFPDDHFDLDIPLSPLNSLGEMRTEASTGRLILTPGFGTTVGVKVNGRVPSLEEFAGAENDQWFDDTSDGPVNAMILFEDGTCQPVAGAWAVAADPGFAPQIRNVVTAWDEVYDTFVREFGLVPDLHDGVAFNPAYAAAFNDDILPLFRAVMLQRWSTNLPKFAVKAHNAIGAITAADDPTVKIPNFEKLIRNPSIPAQFVPGAPMMPLSLGDAEEPFLALTLTQYFLLRQWHGKVFVPGSRANLGPGEMLDRVALANCLGGRFSPGIELSFPMRDVKIYQREWRLSAGGPFRIRAAVLDYTAAQVGRPFLTVGYVPLRDAPLEPGDLSKFMAVPWHTDFNHCAVHPINPNPNNDPTLYWSWPAERPVMVYPQALSRFDAESGWTLGPQLYAVRGGGTSTLYPATAGRFQLQRDFIMNWHKVGFVIQASRIDPASLVAGAGEPFLEVACGFATSADLAVAPWPSFNNPPQPS